MKILIFSALTITQFAYSNYLYEGVLLDFEETVVSSCRFKTELDIIAGIGSLKENYKCVNFYEK